MLKLLLVPILPAVLLSFLLFGCNVHVTPTQAEAVVHICDKNGGPGNYIAVETTMRSAFVTASCRDGSKIERHIQD